MRRNPTPGPIDRVQAQFMKISNQEALLNPLAKEPSRTCILLTAQLLHIPLIKLLSEIPKAAEEDLELQEGELLSDCHYDREQEDGDDNYLLDSGTPEAGEQWAARSLPQW